MNRLHKIVVTADPRRCGDATPPRPRGIPGLASVAVAALLLAGCGQKGSLYLPQAASAPAKKSEVSAPAAPAGPTAPPAR